MIRPTSIALAAVLLIFIAGTSAEFIRPIYRPPPGPRWPQTIRARRDAQEPLWLYKGDNVPRAPSSADHPYLPRYIDPVRLDAGRRYARSVDSPSARRGGGGQRSSGGRDTGPTHPGHNRRNARSIVLPDLPSRFPKPTPYNPNPISWPKTYIRTRIDV